MLGEPPVLTLENRQAYDVLLTRLVLEWKPRHITEWIFVRDIADITWEIRRHRRAIADICAISFKNALQTIFSKEVGDFLWPKPKQLAGAWFKGPKEQQQVKSELAKYGLSPEAIIAQCYKLNRDELDRVHRWLAQAEARCAAATRNFHEYRATSGLREAPVVEAEEAALVPNSS